MKASAPASRWAAGLFCCSSSTSSLEWPGVCPTKLSCLRFHTPGPLHKPPRSSNQPACTVLEAFSGGNTNEGLGVVSSTWFVPRPVRVQKSPSSSHHPHRPIRASESPFMLDSDGAAHSHTPTRIKAKRLGLQTRVGTPMSTSLTLSRSSNRIFLSNSEGPETRGFKSQLGC